MKMVYECLSIPNIQYEVVRWPAQYFVNRVILVPWSLETQGSQRKLCQSSLLLESNEKYPLICIDLPTFMQSRKHAQVPMKDVCGYFEEKNDIEFMQCLKNSFK